MGRRNPAWDVSIRVALVQSSEEKPGEQDRHVTTNEITNRGQAATLSSRENKQVERVGDAPAC